MCLTKKKIVRIAGFYFNVLNDTVSRLLNCIDELQCVQSLTEACAEAQGCTVWEQISHLQPMDPLRAALHAESLSNSRCTSLDYDTNTTSNTGRHVEQSISSLHGMSWFVTGHVKPQTMRRGPGFMFSSSPVV